MEYSDQETTLTLAAKLGKDRRQINNYKTAIEDFLGGKITYSQGRHVYFLPDHVHLVVMYAKGEILPLNLQGSLAPVKQSSSKAIQPDEIIPATHPNLRIQPANSAIAPVTPTALFFTVESKELQRKEFQQETESLTAVTFQNIGGLQEFLRLQLIENFRYAGAADLRDAVGAYHQEVTQGLGVVAKEAKKAGFGGCIDDSKSA